MLKKIAIFLFSIFTLTVEVQAEEIRVKDLGKFQGWRENALTGYGVVTGLAGTGDSPNYRPAKQALSNVLSQFSLSISPDQIQSRNIAVVMVTATLPAYAHEGEALDVTVTSIGDARSLVGGALLTAALQGANGKIYALAQGTLTVGGYRYDANGNVLQKNHPTVGTIPGGGTIEVGVTSELIKDRQVTFLLSEPDITTAFRVATAMNKQLGRELAEVKDPSGITINLPDSGEKKVLMSFLAQLESVSVEPDRRAKVVINERTGTVVTGGEVRISKVAISHGDLKIYVASETVASQPVLVSRPGDNIRTALITNSRLGVNEIPDGTYIPAVHNTVADLVQALSKMRIGTRDVISILKAIKAAGALHGDLVIQ